jgi:transcriptional repressor NrdR
MRCPKCHYTETKVVDTRLSKSGLAIRRRRECLRCNYRFTTTEEVLRENMRVVKVDGSREEFSHAKILRGIRKAMEGRPVEMERLEMLIAGVMEKMEREYVDEIPTRAIGEAVMEGLKDLDKIGYVRFAIAYKDIRDIAQLEEEISAIR